MTLASYHQLRLDEQFCFALYTACHAVLRAYRPLLADLELAYPQYLALLVVWERPGDEAFALTSTMSAELSTTAEAREGMTAFLEKRTPSFSRRRGQPGG